MATLTLCVPAYNAEAFLAETLDSISAQTFRDYKVLISLDQSEDSSETVCRRYLADRRFELIVQPQRLGWVGNVNALIARVDTPFFCIAPHDDLLGPQYLAELHALAASDPGIACAYCDIESFGSYKIPTQQEEIRGGRLERTTNFLLNHFNAVAFRGLVRRQNTADWPCLPTGLRDDFAADTVWMLQLALRGELRRVPAALYAKRYRKQSVHAGWAGRPREDLVALWAEQAVACARLALEHFDDASAREIILAAAWMRATGILGMKEALVPSHPKEVAAAAAIFQEAFGSPPKLQAGRGVLVHPQAHHLREAFNAKAPGLTTLSRRTRWQFWKRG